MRILLISGEFPPMQGGVGDYTREMAREFVRQGHQAWVLTSDRLREAYADQAGLPWRTLPTVHDWKWGCWKQVIQAIRQARPDVVNVQYQAAAYDMRVPAICFLPWRLRCLADRPAVVTTFHDLQTPYLFPKAGPLRTWVVRTLARCSDATIVTNAEDLLTARSWPFLETGGRSTLHQIPIGSNIAASPPPGFQRQDWRARYGYGPDDPVWAYFGFLNESKGGETLIRALARAEPGTSLLMIGGRVGSSDSTNQAYADRMEKLIQELGLSHRIQSTGYMAADQVSAALLSADVLVLPYRDGVSFRRGSLHAALAHGCVIISTTPRVPIPELRDGENILLVPPDDPEAIGRTASRLKHDPTLGPRIGQGARELAEQFTWEHIVRQTVRCAFAPLARRP